MAFSAKYVLVIAAVFVQGQCGMIRRSTDESTPLQQLMENARTKLQAVSDDWSKMSGVNVEEIKSVLEAKTKELETMTKDMVEDLKRKAETHSQGLSEQATAALNEAATKLNQSLEHLKSQAPGTLEEMSALQQRFNDAFKAHAEKMFEATGQLANAAGEEVSTSNTQLTDFTRNALTQAMDVMTQMHNEVQEAVKKATA